MYGETYAGTVKVQRVIAALIDVVLYSVIVAVLVVLSAFAMADLRANWNVLFVPDPESAIIGAFLIVLNLVVGILYYGLLPAMANGQTPAKKLLRIRVIDEKNENPPLHIHFLRAIIVYR